MRCSLGFVALVGLAAGCATRRFNNTKTNETKAEKPVASSRFERELCGLVGLDPGRENSASARSVRLTSFSSRDFAELRGDSHPNRYIDVEFPSALRLGGQELPISTFFACFKLKEGATPAALIAVEARPFTSIELRKSYEIFRCGNLILRQGAFLLEDEKSSWNKQWNVVGADARAEESLSRDVGSRICVIGKPIRFDRGFAVLVDSDSIEKAR